MTIKIDIASYETFFLDETLTNTKYITPKKKNQM